MNVTMSREARERFVRFASKWVWRGNFRDFNASVVRMATFARGGRITEDIVDEEVDRLRACTAGGTEKRRDLASRVLGAEAARRLDRFDRVQLEDVLVVCERAKSLSQAGRELFARSLAERTTANDADRLRKYLARFGIAFGDLAEPRLDPGEARWRVLRARRGRPAGVDDAVTWHAMANADPPLRIK